MRNGKQGCFPFSFTFMDFFTDKSVKSIIIETEDAQREKYRR